MMFYVETETGLTSPTMEKIAVSKLMQLKNLSPKFIGKPMFITIA